MNEQNIKLPDFLIADFYRKSLVELENQPANENIFVETKSVSAKTLDNIKYLGDNHKNVIIAVNQPGSAYLPEEDLQFLTNVLKACQLTLADIAIVNVAAQPASFVQMKEQLSAAQLLLFDLLPTVVALPFTLPHFQLHQYDGCSILCLPALSAMNQPTPESLELKKSLWLNLKKMFNL